MPLTTLAISIWSVAEDPPIRMAEAPIFSTSLANFFDVSNFETSESINTNNNAFFFFNSDFRNNSTLFLVIKWVCRWVFKV